MSGVRRAVIGAIAVALLGACGGGGGSEAGQTTSKTVKIFGQRVPPPVPSTLVPLGPTDQLANGGFEGGLSGWGSFPEPVIQPRVDALARTGGSSVLTPLQSDESQAGGALASVVQDVGAERLPETLTGYYRVDNWQPGGPVQYLDVMVSAVGPRRGSPVPDASNVQLYYVLAGQDRPPFPVGNAKFVFVDRDEPRQGEWVRFELRPREDFRRKWGSTPTGMRFVRLAFGARILNRAPGDPAGGADVRWDDLATSG